MSSVKVAAHLLQTVDPSRPIEYFQSVRELFARAAQAAGGCVERYYLSAGQTIKLSFAGPALILSITRALDHLAVDEAPTPALTILIWDSASTGQSMAPPPWEPEAFLARGVIQGYNDERIFTAFQHGSGAVNLLDAERSLGIFWVPAADDLVYWEKGAPLRTILHWWFASHDRQLVHAAAIGNESYGVLIVGKGGSGKSTTALSCLDSRLLYAGDDYTVLGMDPGPTVYSLYNSAKLDSGHLRRFPQLVPRISNADRLGEEKALLFVNDHYPSKVTTQFLARAILLPRVTGKAETSLSKTSTARGLRALAPSTIFQLPRAGNEAFKFLARFVRSIPCYNLDLGTDLSKIPTVVEGLLQGI